MPRVDCQVCIHAQRSAVDAALLDGQQLKPLAAEYGISVSSLSRHKTRHLFAATPAANCDLDSLESQAALWLSRADDIYSQSAISGDVRGQAQALTGAFRGLELKARQFERDAERAAQNCPDDKIDVRALDQFTQPLIRALDALREGDEHAYETVRALMSRQNDLFPEETRASISQSQN
jgi:hypothetical protein